VVPLSGEGAYALFEATGDAVAYVGELSGDTGPNNQLALAWYPEGDDSPRLILGSSHLNGRWRFEVYRSISDNQFALETAFEQSTGFIGRPTAGVADTDGDGSEEALFSFYPYTVLYEWIDQGYQPTWTIDQTVDIGTILTQRIPAWDLNGDGIKEWVFSQLVIESNVQKGYCSIFGLVISTPTPLPGETPTPEPSPSVTAEPETPTPTPAEETPTPEPSQTPLPLGVRLEVPEWASPGDEFQVMGYLDNPDAPRSDVPVFFLLDVFGDFWFWDSWTHYVPPDGQIDYQTMNVPTGTTPITVVPAFTWPDTGTDSVSGLRFWGAMLSADLRGILGGYASATWGYGPRATAP
jgi:hypothetical protein